MALSYSLTMADPRLPDPALLIVAVFSRHPDAISWAHQRLEAGFGPIALASDPYRFHHTAYYEPEMGPDLQKQFLAFQDLRPLDELACIKGVTNDLERQLAA